MLDIYNVLDAISEIVYVSDAETHEILYINAPALSTAKRLMPRMFRGESTMVRRQWLSQGCSHTRAHTEGKGLSLRIRRMASA